MKKIIILLSIFLLSSCSNLEVVTDEPEIRSQKAGIGAREHINILVDQIERRVAGTPGEMQAARYIEDVFVQLGYELEVQEFDISSKPGMGLDVPTSKNIIASKPGVSEKEIIVGAHYDSVDIGDGADDNASSVAVVLHVAGQVVSESYNSTNLNPAVWSLKMSINRSGMRYLKLFEKFRLQSFENTGALLLVFVFRD